MMGADEPGANPRVTTMRAGAGFEPIQVRTLADRVYEAVRDRIMSGEMAAGEPIRQDSIAGELGISKIPLREALARLEEYGLVSSSANRGFVVSALSAGEAEEVFALRLKLEPDAMVRASRHASDADHEAARSALGVLDAKVRTSSLDQGIYNRIFHMALIQPAAGRITVTLIERLNVIADRYVRLHLRPEGRNSRANAEHREILDCWINRDLRRLEQLAKLHIRDTLNDLRQQLG